MLIYKDMIKTLVEGFLKARDIAVVKDEEDLWHAELSPGLATDLDCPQNLILSFSPEAFERNRESLLVTDGSPLLSSIRDILKKDGFLAQGYLGIDKEKLLKIQGNPPGNLEFDRCLATVDASGISYEAFARFLFNLSIEGVDRREELAPVFVDLSGPEIMEPPPDILIEAILLEAPPVSGEIITVGSIDDAMKKAREHLEKTATPVLVKLSDESGKALIDELIKLNEFFKLQQTEAKTQQEKELLKSACREKTDELKKKYLLKVSGQVVHLMIIYAPVITVRVRLERGRDAVFFDSVYRWVRDSWDPINCGICDKEIKKLSFCKEHGVCHAHEIWKCPVCQEERCEKCEYLICGVDGKKKDPGCSFQCQFCLSSAGKDHLIRCDICGREGCSNCIGSCSICGKKVCPDCGSSCTDCGKIFCREHMTECEKCKGAVCSSCGLKKCHKCGASVCGQHSFICGGCGKTFCRDCSGGVDAETSKLLCSQCARVCGGCRKTVKAESVGKCGKCGAETCSFCRRTCAECGEELCRIHTGRCGICGKDMCNEHLSPCIQCGGTICKSHYFSCSSCGLEYCTNCREEESGGAGEICRLCGSLAPLKKKKIPDRVKAMNIKGFEPEKLNETRYGEKAGLFAFSGKGLLEEHLVVADKKTGKVLCHRRHGIMEKLRGIFSGKK